MTPAAAESLMDAIRQSPSPIRTRWMIRRDMLTVLGIENASFEHAWTEENFLNCLRARNCVGMVAEHLPNDETVGFMIYELRPKSMTILNFAVDPNFRRQDVGTKMIDKLVSKLSAHRRDRIIVNVRESNLAAQLFFRSQGFRATKVLRGFYQEDTGEDAYVMRYSMGDAAE